MPETCSSDRWDPIDPAAPDRRGLPVPMYAEAGSCARAWRWSRRPRATPGASGRRRSRHRTRSGRRAKRGDGSVVTILPDGWDRYRAGPWMQGW